MTMRDAEELMALTNSFKGVSQVHDCVHCLYNTMLSNLFVFFGKIEEIQSVYILIDTFAVVPKHQDIVSVI